MPLLTRADRPQRTSVNLLIYCDDPEMGGVGHHCLAVIRAAQNLGWEVHYAQPRFEHALLSEAEADGARMCWVSYNTTAEFARTITDARDAERILEYSKPDMIVFADCCQVSNIAAKHAAITRGIPFVVICHSAATYLASRFASCLPVVRRQYAQAAGVIAVSQCTLDVARKHYGLAPEKGIVVHSGRPARFFEPRSQETRLQIRRALGIPADAVVSLTTARLTEDKGFTLQFMAILQLKQEGRLGNLRFIWAGNGPLLPMLRQAVAAQGLAGHIHCLGQREDVHALYDAADIFVLPTLHEAFGLSVVEAMAKGLAVAASRVEGIPEVLADAGVLLPDPNAGAEAAIAAIKRTLISLSREGSRVAELGVRGRERAARFFTETRMVADLAAALSETRERQANAVAPATLPRTQQAIS